MNLHGKVVGRCLSRAFSRNKPAPGFVTLMDDFGGILLILCLTGESESILGFSIRDLVDPEPFGGSTNEAR